MSETCRANFNSPGAWDQQDHHIQVVHQMHTWLHTGMATKLPTVANSSSSWMTGPMSLPPGMSLAARSSKYMRTGEYSRRKVGGRKEHKRGGERVIWQEALALPHTPPPRPTCTAPGNGPSTHPPTHIRHALPDMAAAAAAALPPCQHATTSCSVCPATQCAATTHPCTRRARPAWLLQQPLCRCEASTRLYCPMPL